MLPLWQEEEEEILSPEEEEILSPEELTLTMPELRYVAEGEGTQRARKSCTSEFTVYPVRGGEFVRARLMDPTGVHQICDVNVQVASDDGKCKCTYEVPAGTQMQTALLEVKVHPILASLFDDILESFFDLVPGSPFEVKIEEGDSDDGPGHGSPEEGNSDNGSGRGLGQGGPGQDMEEDPQSHGLSRQDEAQGSLRTKK